MGFLGKVKKAARGAVDVVESGASSAVSAAKSASRQAPGLGGVLKTTDVLNHLKMTMPGSARAKRYGNALGMKPPRKPGQ